MKYAETADVEAGFRPLSAEQGKKRCDELLEEAALSSTPAAHRQRPKPKKLVSCRMVRRVLVMARAAPRCSHGATQGSARRWAIAELDNRNSGTVGGTVPFETGKKAAGRRQQDRRSQPVNASAIGGIDVVVVKTRTGEAALGRRFGKKHPETGAKCANWWPAKRRGHCE